MDKCPHCGVALPAVQDAFCLDCGKELDSPPENGVRMNGVKAKGPQHSHRQPLQLQAPLLPPQANTRLGWRVLRHPVRRKELRIATAGLYMRGLRHSGKRRIASGSVSKAQTDETASWLVR